jgi:putative transposase
MGIREMSKKRTTYSAELKSKLVIEVLKGDKTLNEIASENGITPKNLQNWKKQFLENANLAFDRSAAVKEYKEEIIVLKKEKDQMAKKVGELTIERDFVVEKLKSSVSSKKRKEFVESEHKNISVNKQCLLLNISRTMLYYKPIINEQEIAIKKRISEIYEEIPIYGYLKVHQQLLEDGYSVCENTVHKYRKELGLKAVLAVKAPGTTIVNKEHPIYSYKLKDIDIIRANQVWSTDITYIKTKTGFVFMAAIIDWYSKAILSYRVANCMDSDLVMTVLNDALDKYGKPEIFNTDQGSQYTSFIHTQTLKDNGITISMDGKGRAVDNICIERFWRSAKVERIYLNEYDSISDLKIDIKDYIQFYNQRRFHETLDYKKPMNVYLESIKMQSEIDQNQLQLAA